MGFEGCGKKQPVTEYLIFVLKEENSSILLWNTESTQQRNHCLTAWVCDMICSALEMLQ